jgi:hypothetical protein
MNDQSIHKEMFNILSHKANAIQNGIETPSHPSQNGNHQKTAIKGGERRPIIHCL